jgi:hypothetical protein
MYHLATAPRGIGQVLDSVFQLTRASFFALLPFAALVGLVSSIPLVYMIWTGALNDPARLATMMFTPGYWIATLVMLPLMFVAYGGAIVRAEAVAQGEPLGFGESVRKVLPQLFTIILAAICFAIAVGVGLVLLVIPGVILMVSLYLFLPAILLDGKGAFDSLTHSHSLVWGNWWRTMAIVTIAVIVMYVLFLLVGVVIGIFFGFAGADPVFLILVNLATTTLGGLLLMPLFTALYVEIYRDLKMRKSGGDLAARIEAVGTTR